MKIVCDSCSAKYSIADEKVAGRTFKIRCKKCGSSIVVKGDAAAAQAPVQQQSYAQDYGGDAVWHVVVGNDQQGPISPAQMGELLTTGQIGWDAYVWREGFDDWKPAQDIPELVSAITGGADDGGGNDGFGGEESTMVRPDLQAQLAQASQQPQARTAARAESARPQANVGFGAFAAPAAASHAFGGEDDVVASKPQARSPQPAGAALTGARNENSVLFSLSNLQALATGTSGSASASKSVAPVSSSGRAGMAQGEGSGLIDIRALASAAKAPMNSHGSGRVDDLLNLGSVGIGPTISAPVMVPDRKSNDGNSKTILIAAAIIAVGLIGAIGLAAVFLRPAQTDPVASNAIPTMPVVPQVPTTPTTPTNAAGANAVAPAPLPTTPATEAAAPAHADNGAAARGSGGAASHRRERDHGGGGTAAAAATPAASESGSRRGNSGSSLGNDLLAALEHGGTGGGTSRPAASASAGASSGLPETPPQADVRSALQGQQSAVAACGGGQHGVATVTITFSGSSGRVTNAVVAGQFAGTPVGSCIARAVRSASVPRFSRPTLSVGYPYRI